MDLVQGIFTVLFIAFSVLVGIRILLEYFKLKRKIFIWVGITWIGICSPWYPNAINFVMIVFYNASLSDFWFFILNVSAFPPIVSTAWIIALPGLINIKKRTRNLFLIINFAIHVVFDIFFYYYLFTDISMIGKKISPFYVEWTLFVIVYFFYLIFLVLSGGFTFVWKSVKSGKPEIVLRGKLLFVAFTLFIVGASIDAAINMSDFPSMVVITRLILISSSFFFYMGFLFPIWVKKRLLKEV
jgi:hypothetical protein